MTVITTKTHTCDRCGTQRQGEAGTDFDWGYVSFGPVNGALDEHVGERTRADDHADLCERCRETLLRWWRAPRMGKS